MTLKSKRITNETKQVENHLRRYFPNTVAYRYNPAAIRVRIVDGRFQRVSRSKRFDMVIPYVRELPEKTQQDVSLLLLLTPDELQTSERNWEFENPSTAPL